jgi:hypothetical protein
MSTRFIHTRRSNCDPPSKSVAVCAPRHTPRFQNLESMADHYIRKHRARFLKEFKSFRKDSTLKDCIRRAARALNEKREKHPHQWRVPPAALDEFANILVRREMEIARCKSFEELFAIVKAASKDIWRHAELTVYDTAWRIAGRLGLEPEAVYLHAGTRVGARALGITGRGPIPLKRFPPGFLKLKPREIEDCLCMYADELKYIMEHKNRS